MLRKKVKWIFHCFPSFESIFLPVLYKCIVCADFLSFFQIKWGVSSLTDSQVSLHPEWGISTQNPLSSASMYFLHRKTYSVAASQKPKIRSLWMHNSWRRFVGEYSKSIHCSDYKYSDKILIEHQQHMRHCEKQTVASYRQNLTIKWKEKSQTVQGNMVSPFVPAPGPS